LMASCMSSPVQWRSFPKAIWLSNCTWCPSWLMCSAITDHSRDHFRSLACVLVLCDLSPECWYPCTYLYDILQWPGGLRQGYLWPHVLCSRCSVLMLYSVNILLMLLGVKRLWCWVSACLLSSLPLWWNAPSVQWSIHSTWKYFWGEPIWCIGWVHPRCSWPYIL
jgi:hypothetical protein